MPSVTGRAISSVEQGDKSGGKKGCLGKMPLKKQMKGGNSFAGGSGHLGWGGTAGRKF